MSKTPDHKTQKRAARLMAVQGVYAMLSDNKTAEELIPAYLSHYSGMEIDEDILAEPDQDAFKTVIQGVGEHKNTLEAEIIAAIGERQTPVSMSREPLLFAILLCGSYEIKNRYDIDIPIIISDYMHVCHAFFDGNEPKLVNAVLDKIGKAVQA